MIQAFLRRANVYLELQEIANCWKQFQFFQRVCAAHIQFNGLQRQQVGRQLGWKGPQCSLGRARLSNVQHTNARLSNVQLTRTLKQRQQISLLYFFHICNFDICNEKLTNTNIKSSSVGLIQRTTASQNRSGRCNSLRYYQMFHRHTSTAPQQGLSSAVIGGSQQWSQKAMQPCVYLHHRMPGCTGVLCSVLFSHVQDSYSRR